MENLLQITSFRNIKTQIIIPLQKDGLYHTEPVCQKKHTKYYTAEAYLNSVEAEIFSVRRLTDGVEFHIGDNFIWSEETIFEINKINWEAGQISCVHKSSNGMGYGQSLLIAKKIDIVNMRRFKLIKLYPNSPEIDSIGCVGFRGLKLESFTMFPEYWKELTKPFTVIRYSDGFNDYYLKKNGMYTVNGVHEYNYADLTRLDKSSLHIKTVRRESDGEKFSLGDKVADKDGVMSTIKRFMISANFSCIKIYPSEPVNFILLDDATIIDTLFTTTDAVQVTEKSFHRYDFYHVDEYFNKVRLCYPMDYDYDKYINRLFSSAKAANEFIYNHKPVYSEKQYQQALAPKGGDGMND
jgi:hypothetical protein